MKTLGNLLTQLDDQHRKALLWFQEHAGTVQGWPQPLSDGTLLATKAKGIYKPKWSKYALSVRQAIKDPYPDKDPVFRSDGKWEYRYYQEDIESDNRDAHYTNRGLLACQTDGVPVGVMRQIKPKPNSRYEILGLAIVANWENGYFRLEGFSR